MNCAFPNDEDKAKCIAMRDGNCTKCKGKCHWKTHNNMAYWFKETKEWETIENEEMLARYTKADSAHT